jgi:hypothetical protein
MIPNIIYVGPSPPLPCNLNIYELDANAIKLLKINTIGILL